LNPYIAYYGLESVMNILAQFALIISEYVNRRRPSLA